MRQCGIVERGSRRHPSIQPLAGPVRGRQWGKRGRDRPSPPSRVRLAACSEFHITDPRGLGSS